MGLLERFLEEVRKRGGDGDVRPVQSPGVDADGSVSVPTTGLTIRPRANRTSILVVNQDGANFVKARIGGAAMTASSQAGIRLDAAGGSFALERELNGSSVDKAIHLVADTGACIVYVFEEEAY